MAFLHASRARSPPARCAQRHLVIEHDVIADLRSFTHHYARAMIDEKALADLRTRVNFDAPRYKTRELRDQARYKRDMRLVERVSDAMIKNSTQTLREKRFEDIATEEISPKNDL